jgi:PTH1 family peptidyl-tRNA hydrolase
VKLIAGLGNPGLFYRNNRHNIGFMCVNYIARANGIRLDKKRGNARTGTGEISGVPVLLARPQTGMNVSGQSVSALLDGLKLEREDLIVIHDDLDLPPGKIRVRYGGGSGGHNGIISVMEHLGSGSFYRIRVGIGRPCSYPDRDKEMAVIKYVLSDFPSEEVPVLNDAIPRVSEAVCCLLTEGLTAAMNRFN